jgi:hypothetical protein
MGKIIGTSQKEFVDTVFVELFTVHLSEKNSRFYHFLKPRYMRNKNVAMTHPHPVLPAYFLKNNSY